MEGMMAVKLMNARAAEDEEAMEAAVIAMEGFVGDVWEALKEIVKKAYTAIKTFLIKVWNKFKGYGNVVKAFFTKYGDVLRHKRVPGLRVKWEEIRVTAAEPVMNRFLDVVRRKLETLQRDYIAGLIAHARTGERADKEPETVLHKHQEVNSGFPTPNEINDALDDAIYPEKAHSDDQLEKDFEQIRPEAIKAADASSYKKYIDNFMAIGNKRYAADLKCIEDIKREVAKLKGEASGAGITYIHTEARRCLNAEIEIINLSTHAMTTAAKRMQSQSISACRKAIMYHATEGDGATYADESYTPNGDSYFDGLMKDLGY
jgi:hypothetical protein